MDAAVPPVTFKDLPAALAALENADRAQLLDLWRDLIGTPPPKNLSLPFLRRALAFELQVQVHCGPTARTIVDLGRIVVGNVSHSSVGTKPMPGATLVREWQGRTWTVEVVEAGFLMSGERYTSLSAIARRITGARWSGPRFFGLAEKNSADGPPEKTSGHRRAA